MDAIAGEPATAGAAQTPVADALSATVFLDNDEQYGLERGALEAFQLQGARQRFEELRPSVAALRDQADRAGATRIDTLDDIVPLLFSHSVYKSYPVSIVESRRFDMLTRWLQRSTTVDLSGVDVSGCTGIDDWMDTLERETPVQVYHTSGTSGKLSFFARSRLERDLWNIGFLKVFEGFGDEPGVRLGGEDGERMPVIYPSVRNGRYMAQRLVSFLSDRVAPTPDQCYTLNNGTMSADITALSGRIRIAQAKGTISEMRLSDSERAALKQYIAETERRPKEIAAFFDAMLTRLRGKRVFLFSQTSYLAQAAQEGLSRGVRGILAPDSVIQAGGGGKGVVLPEGWAGLIRDFTGVDAIGQGYGMTELTASMARCPHGHYHFQQFIIPFLLTDDGGTALPRHGRQTGRFGALDLAAQNLWGGLVTGDRLSIEWDAPCRCGRKSAYIVGEIGRYDETVTGDDKISCAATINNTDAALQTLLNA